MTENFGETLGVGGRKSGGGGIPRRNSSIFRSIKAKMRKKNQQSAESTQRMLAICKETEKIGSTTMVTLHSQKDQINNIESGLHHMDEDMKDAENNLEELDKWCGLCVLPWKSHRTSYKPPATDRSAQKSSSDQGGRYNIQHKTQMIYVKKETSESGYITRIANDKHEEEMESNLTDVGSLICSLRNLACDMSHEIDSQNSKLDAVNDKSYKLHDRLQVANHKADKLLKSS